MKSIENQKKENTSTHFNNQQNTSNHSFGNSIPLDGLAGLVQNWKYDIKSGFLIFLIALPLCLGISLASGVPPMAGIISTVVGGIIVSLLSGSYLTINGPAAGLIVVILTAVETLGNGDAILGYQTMLAAVVMSGILLVILGYTGAGVLGDFFPSSVIHGMMAAIGIIIISKQIHIVFGVIPNSSEPIYLFLELPKTLAQMNLPIAVIGISVFVFLITYRLIKNPYLRKIPPPFFVVILALLSTWILDLKNEHKIFLFGKEYEVGRKYLINLPENLLDGITNPNWSKINITDFWLIVLSITFVQGLESMLASMAIDKLDPYKRKSNLNKDLRAIGLGNIVSGMIGGLPMIAEVVRSSANVRFGAKTRWSNFFHGLFMLIFVIFFPEIIRSIPSSALAALLIWVGYQLTSLKHFIHTYKIGFNQLIIFVSTIIVTISTDLLIGVTSGMIVNIMVNYFEGRTQLKYLFTNNFKVQLLDQSTNRFEVKIKEALVFSNLLYFKSVLKKIPDHSVIELDFSEAKIVGHSAFESLEQLKPELRLNDKIVIMKGLEHLVSTSSYPTSTKVKR